MHIKFYEKDGIQFATADYGSMYGKDGDEGYVSISSNLILKLKSEDIVKILKDAAEKAIVDFYYYQSLNYTVDSMLMCDRSPETLIDIEYEINRLKEIIDSFENIDPVKIIELNRYKNNLSEWLYNYDEVWRNHRIQEIKENRLNKKKTQREKDVGYIYILKSELGYKIGKSKTLNNRMSVFNVKMPFAFESIFDAQIENYHSIEKELHELYADKNINGEWFNLSDEDIEAIKNICV